MERPSMPVMRALLLSSSSKAEASVNWTATGVLAQLHPYECYRLIVSHSSAITPEQEGDTYVLDVCVVTYPHKAEGKGWGDPVVMKPHKVCQFTGKAAFLAYLTEFDFHPDEYWHPVENEE